MTRTSMKTLQHLRESVPQVDVSEAVESLQAGARLIDVREADETALGSLNDALLIPLGEIYKGIEADIPDVDSPLIVYCATGVRSLFAVDHLQSIGYTNVANLTGGIEAWKLAGQPVSQPQHEHPALSERYSRHHRIPEIGIEGQKKLLQSRVLIIGAGGLGSPVGLYLAAAGVGTIGIIDDDVVDLSNLHRQILHGTSDVGMPKVESSSCSMTALNPDVQVIPHQLRLTDANALDILGEYDVIVDGSDNFETRYFVNDACVQLGIPQVHGSIFRFDGQVTVFDPRRADSPCYRCLFPEAPPPELAPNCAVAGVLGVLPGVIGTIQATEAIKLLLGLGEPLVGRLLVYDALGMIFRTLKVQRDPHCPTCGEQIERS